jgi:aminobenzoyl-glutamate utilization protein B
MLPTMRTHRVVTNGGDQPNTVPRLSSVWWYFRDSTAEGARALFEQAKKIAEGAAMMTNTAVDVDIMSAVWPTRSNQVLAELVHRNMEDVGVPNWTPEEEAFARELQARANVAVDGLKRAVPPLKASPVRNSSASDTGDVSWKVPMTKLYYPANVPNVSPHYWAAGVAIATSIAHKGALAGAKVLALSAIDCLENPALVEEARVTFKKELGGVEYKSLLPPDQTPPIELNRAMMDKYRPAMAKHYITGRPHFS